MDNGKAERLPEEDISALREHAGKRGVLPCGSKVCLCCHKGCGAVMAAYLSGLDEEQTISE